MAHELAAGSLAGLGLALVHGRMIPKRRMDHALLPARLKE